jgi:hypothetical protein
LPYTFSITIDAFLFSSSFLDLCTVTSRLRRCLLAFATPPSPLMVG